jgi:rfaE bifunctional protein kinase chain/domain
MDCGRFHVLAGKFKDLQVAVLGDFCLDRYLEIDPSREEVSIETGLPVHNVVSVRAQPGGAGTILNNLAALGVGSIFPIGFAGEDGEGFELMRALQARPGVRLDHFIRTPERRTFTYCKPLILSPGKAPVELNRLDSKNWTPTPPSVQQSLLEHLSAVAPTLDALIVLDQVDVAETGVVTRMITEALPGLGPRDANPPLFILADSRRGLKGYPPVVFKMNATELSALTGRCGDLSPAQVQEAAAELAHANGRSVFVSLAERGIVGANPKGLAEHAPALPLRGEIDIVGAGDAVSANLTAAMAAGATLREALEISMAAASVVIHKLGTTGTATPAEIAALLEST